MQDKPKEEKNIFGLSKTQTDNLGGLSYRFFDFFTSQSKYFRVYSPINSAEVFAYRTASLVIGPCFFIGITAFWLGASILGTIALPFTLPIYLLEKRNRINAGIKKRSQIEDEMITFFEGIPLGLIIGIYSAINIGLSFVINAIDLIVCTTLAISGKFKGGAPTKLESSDHQEDKLHAISI